MTRAIAWVVVLAALVAACAFPEVRSGRAVSGDALLDLVVVVRIGAGERERQHEVFVGIGNRGENPAYRYLHAEYTYLLAGAIDWRVTWHTPERVQLEILETPRDPAKAGGAHRIALMTYVRNRLTGRFEELAGEGGGRGAVV